MKLCKDCRYMQVSGIVPVCTHGSNLRPDYVYGDDATVIQSIGYMRSEEHKCGPDAKLFEHKLPSAA